MGITFRKASMTVKMFTSLKNALLSGKQSYYTTYSSKMSNNLPIKNNILSITLAEAKQGCSYRVTNIAGIASDRLAELGLTAGVAVTVLRAAPLGDPLEIALRGYRLCLRKETARHVLVTDITPQTSSAKTAQKTTRFQGSFF